jgi:hypothetical protein
MIAVYEASKQTESPDCHAHELKRFHKLRELRSGTGTAH